MHDTFAAASLLLILVTDPIGNSPIFARQLAVGA